MDITRQLFEEISAGKYVIYSSAIVIAEVENADEETLRKLDILISKHAPVMLNLTEEAEELADAYIIQGIIPHRKKDDALHIAVSTVYEMDALVSWNYKHLANINKKERIRAVNLLHGYLKELEMITPMEVANDE